MLDDKLIGVRDYVESDEFNQLVLAACSSQSVLNERLLPIDFQGTASSLRELILSDLKMRAREAPKYHLEALDRYQTEDRVLSLKPIVEERFRTEGADITATPIWHAERNKQVLSLTGTIPIPISLSNFQEPNPQDFVDRCLRDLDPTDFSYCFNIECHAVIHGDPILLLSEDKR